MSDTAKKPAWKSPEFMAAMREKALAKRAETKKIKEAEKLKAMLERHTKLAEADKILNPQPEPAPQVPEPAEDVPLPPKKTTRKAAPRRELDITDVGSATPTVSYKEEYYKRKLELLERQTSTPKQTRQQPASNPAYQLAKQDIAQHVNKSVMDTLWKSYFADSPSPYE